MFFYLTRSMLLQRKRRNKFYDAYYYNNEEEIWRNAFFKFKKKSSGYFNFNFIAKIRWSIPTLPVIISFMKLFVAQTSRTRFFHQLLLNM